MQFRHPGALRTAFELTMRLGFLVFKTVEVPDWPHPFKVWIIARFCSEHVDVLSIRHAMGQVVNILGANSVIVHHVFHLLMLHEARVSKLSSRRSRMCIGRWMRTMHRHHHHLPMSSLHWHHSSSALHRTHVKLPLKPGGALADREALL